MQFGFDIISDLNLTKDDKLDWEGKATSLYCLIPGNISDNMHVVLSSLRHLSNHYHGVFYIDGSLENTSLEERERRTEEIAKICSSLKNVVYLHNHVVVVDGIALVGINGWYGNHKASDSYDLIRLEMFMHEDLAYLGKTIEKLQLHVDVKKVVIMSNSVPSKELYFGEAPVDMSDGYGPVASLVTDTEGKVTTWIFGTYDKTVDTVINGVHYLNNPSYRRQPYWPKRLNIEIK